MQQPQIPSPKITEGISPIIISAPVPRTGTTLMQRLITSSKDAIIFGENAANELQFFANFYTTRYLFFQQGTDYWDNMLEKTLKGDVNEWIADLLPPMDDYVPKLAEACFHTLNYYQEYAASQGRGVFGYKIAGWNMHILRLMKTLIPGTKVIYIHRKPEEAAKSAKTVQMVNSPEEIQEFARTWALNLSPMVDHWDSGDLLLVNYHELLENPDKVFPEIEEFAGIGPMDRNVLGHRVNTFTSDLGRAPKGDGYIPLVELTEDELERIHSVTGDLAKKLYG